MRAYVDSDILIWHLRGERRAADFLARLASEPQRELWIGALQRAEIVFFMRGSEERNTLAFLSRFKTQAATQSVVDRAGRLYREWNPSHGIDVNDAFLAAMIEETGGVLYTLNLRHYPMPGIRAQKAW